jgi:hypothetical protein
MRTRCSDVKLAKETWGMHTTFLSEDLMRRYHMEDLDVDGKINIKVNLKTNWV